ncbi:MAG: RHS repeat domain-containing protein [Planctomycetota bacterium]|jgi:RHS repeat-associated protein
MDKPICMIDVKDSSTVYYYHHDALGSVVAPSDSAGDTVQLYDYDVYGNFAASDPGHTNPYLFTGRRYDKETDLYYYRIRHYNAHLGRFLQADRIGYGDGMNMYAYCSNNPWNMVDPHGLKGNCVMSDPRLGCLEDCCDPLYAQQNPIECGVFYSNPHADPLVPAGGSDGGGGDGGGGGDDGDDDDETLSECLDDALEEYTRCLDRAVQGRERRRAYCKGLRSRLIKDCRWYPRGLREYCEYGAEVIAAACYLAARQYYLGNLHACTGEFALRVGQCCARHGGGGGHGPLIPGPFLR